MYNSGAILLRAYCLNKVVQCKWVLHIKQDKDGQISHFKGHLVAKGFTQIPRQDYTFTFAPIAHWDSIRSILCIDTLNNLELRHINVKNAYLNAPLKEEIYMVMPEECGTRYWTLRNGRYGRRQASRQWYIHLHETYLSLRFSRCKSDWSMYTRRSATSISISATSVDDLLLASNSKAESNLTTTQIQNKFAITDGGNTEWLLGCRIHRWRDRKLLTINQERFTSQILAKFKMEHCNAIKTPCPSYHLTSAMCPSNAEQCKAVAQLPFCTLVGKCMYLANCTQPDISYAICKLAKFMSNYGMKHYKAAKHLLQYLQGTRSQGLTYGNSPNPYPSFRAFADLDWAMSEGWKSISGFLIECGGSIIAWSSKQQVIVALLSCEAEYIACLHCAWQILWQ